MNPAKTSKRRATVLLLGLAGLAVAALIFMPAFPQPLWYHNFADQRCLWCIPHALNVVSNLPFVVVGIWGVLYLLLGRRLEGFEFASERWPYVAFFGLIALTGVGSAYYHLDPNNDRLLWDRLPLAMAFMALFSIIVAERIDRGVGMALLIPLVVVGGASVIYWHATETWGHGDLRPYLLVQFSPLLALPIILLLFSSRYTGTADLYAALGLYVLAKALEILDKAIYSRGEFISGHTLKHLVAALAPLLILHMIWRRRLLDK